MSIIELRPWGILWAFPSGEHQVEWMQKEEDAQIAAAKAAREAPGRIVHIIKRVQSGVMPPQELVWG